MHHIFFLIRPYIHLLSYFHNPNMSVLRMNEVEMIHVYLKSIGVASDWWDRVKAGTQDPWEHLRNNDPNSQMRQFTLKVK